MALKQSQPEGEFALSHTDQRRNVPAAQQGDRRHVPVRRRHTIAPARPIVAPSALILPDIGRGVPKQFENSGDNTTIAAFTKDLVELGILRQSHWTGNLEQSCCKAMAHFAVDARPKPGVELRMHLWDNIEEDMGEGEHYRAAYPDFPMDAKICAITLGFDHDNLCHCLVGDAITSLEDYHPRLGQTVLDLIDDGLRLTTRGLLPSNGLDWASNAYWHGYEDETFRVQEELDYLEHQYQAAIKNKDATKKELKKPVADDIEVFRRRDYEAVIPRHFTRPRPLSLATLQRLRPKRHHRKMVRAAIALRKRLQGIRPRSISDNLHQFENGTAEAAPFVLRWNKGDPIAQIYDDIVNDLMNAGEVQLDCCTLFAFHNRKTLADALTRLRGYLELLNATEALIRTVAKPL